MSSMKSFKSRISQKRGDSRSKINMSSQTIRDYNLKNVQMSAGSSFQFRLQKQGDRIVVAPFVLRITNNTGCMIFLHATTSKQEYFNIINQKNILDNGDTYEVTFKLIELSGVQLEDYARENFQIYWGRISNEEIQKKFTPHLSEQRAFKCTFLNKEIIDQILVKKSYHKISRPSDNMSASRNMLNRSNAAQITDERSQFMKSRQNASKRSHHVTGPQQSLLTMNVIIGVAVVSFLIGFLGS